MPRILVCYLRIIVLLLILTHFNTPTAQAIGVPTGPFTAAQCLTANATTVATDAAWLAALNNPAFDTICIVDGLTVSAATLTQSGVSTAAPRIIMAEDGNITPWSEGAGNFPIMQTPGFNIEADNIHIQGLQFIGDGVLTDQQAILLDNDASNITIHGNWFLADNRKQIDTAENNQTYVNVNIIDNFADGTNHLEPNDDVGFVKTRPTDTIQDWLIQGNEALNFTDAIALDRSTVAGGSDSILIYQNHLYIDTQIYTDCAGALNPAGPCAAGENAIDLHLQNTGPIDQIVIRENIMNGFRTNDEAVSSSGQGRSPAIALLSDGGGVLVERNTMFDTSYCLVSSGNGGNLIRNNVCTDWGYFDDTLTGGVPRAYQITSDNNTLVNNTIHDSKDPFGSGTPAYLQDTGNNTIFKSNTIIDNNGSGDRFQGTNNGEYCFNAWIDGAAQENGGGACVVGDDIISTSAAALITEDHTVTLNHLTGSSTITFVNLKQDLGSIIVDGGDPTIPTAVDRENVTRIQPADMGAFEAALGSITIIKDTNPDDAQDFAFTSTTAPLNFILDDDADGTFSNTEVFANLVDGVYTFEETVVAGWTLTSITCVGETNSTFTITSPSVEVTLADSENLTCTFLNEPAPPTLTIIKNTVPDDAQDFAFTSDSVPAAFNLDDDADGTLSNQQVFTTTNGTTINVQETVPVAGYDLTDITCTGETNSTFTIGGTAAFVAGDDDVSVTLQDNENVICTFENTSQTGSITLIKDDVDDTDTAFTFTATGLVPAAPVLSDPTTPQQVYAGVVNGVYTLDETVVAGWRLTDITCTGESTTTYLFGGDATFEDGDTDVQITLANNDNIECTFTNEEILADITIEKVAVPNDGTLFDFTASGGLAPAAFQLADSGSQTFLDVPEGTFTFAEIIPAGWDLDSIDCTGMDLSTVTYGGDGTFDAGDTDATIIVSSSDTITCTFDNSSGTVTAILCDPGVEENQASGIGDILGATLEPVADDIVALHFPALNLEQNAQILDARLIITASTAAIADASWIFNGHEHFNSPAPDGTPFNIHDRFRTDEEMVWSVEQFVSGTDYTSPDFSAILRHLTRLNGWTTASGFTLIIRGTAARQFHSCNVGGFVPKLQLITDVAPATPTPVVTATPLPTLAATATFVPTATITPTPTPATASGCMEVTQYVAGQPKILKFCYSQ